MKPRFTIIVALVLLLSCITVPQAKAADFSYWGLIRQIESKNPMSYLQKLASPEFQGRQTGFEGEKITTEFIADHFRSIGLTPAGDNGTFFQQVPMDIVSPASPIDFRQLDSNGSSLRQFSFKKDYNVLQTTGSGNVKGDSVFCGYGISAKEKANYDDYAGIDVKGRIAIIFRGGPSFLMAMAQSDPSIQNKLNFQTKVANAQAHGAIGVLLIENPLYPKERRLPINQRVISAYDSGLPSLHLSVETGDIVLSETGKTCVDIAGNIESQKKPYSFPLSKGKYQIQVTIVVKENYRSPNVVGYVPSSDPFGSNETILIGAHWDHLGKDQTGDVYAGANDNASGVACMMEVARVFAANKTKLRMNLAFAAFTGEEIGLLGSWFMAENSPFPTEGLTVLNLDMVGGKPNAIRCATDKYFEDLNSKMTQAALRVGADFKMSGPSQGGSDHYPFYAKGIQSVFILASADMPSYHVPEDTIDKIYPDGIVNVCKMVAMTACLYSDPFYLSLDEEGPVSVGTPEYEIAGYAGKGAHVYVGGRNTIASETGRFTLTVPLVKGPQTLKVTAVKPGSSYRIEKEIGITFELRSKAESSISQINFGYVSSVTKEVKFNILNKGEGPLSGTVRACGDWMEISPEVLQPGTTEIVAKVKIEKLTEPGFHICMLEIETNNGRFYIPVTAITGEPLVALDIVTGAKKAQIAGTDIPLDNPLISVGENFFVPMSIISMAFGATFTFEENHATIALGNRKTTVWPDSDIALVGNEPFKLAGNVYGIGKDFMIPLDLVKKLGISAEYATETRKHHLTYDATTFAITWKPKDLIYDYNPQTPVMEQGKFILGANKPTPAMISTDSDWMAVFPRLADIGPFPTEIKISLATARFTKQQMYKGNILVLTDHGQFKIPVVVSSKTSDRLVTVQIGSNKGTIDGKQVELTSPPFIEGGTTMVPYRFLGEAFGASVEWIAESKTVRTTLGRTTVELVIGNKTAKVNGIPTTLSKAPKIVNGKTFVPFRFIGEAFKATVDWEQETKTVTVKMDMLAGNPKLSVKPREVDAVWADATSDKTPPINSVEVRNEGLGTLTILETSILGNGLKSESQKDRIIITPLFAPKGIEDEETLFIKTNAGSEFVRVNLAVYPKDTSIIRSNADGSWHINGNRQLDPYKRIQDLVSIPAARVSGASGGSSLYDETSGLLTIKSSGHSLELNTVSGDFSVDGAKTSWKFRYALSETDVSLPLAAYALAFGWQIKEMPDGTVRMTIPKDKPPFLASNRKSIDLIWDQTPKRMSVFSMPTYPLKNNGSYDFEKSTGKFRLFMFFAANQNSESLIPYVESLSRRFQDKGLTCALVSTTIKSDMAIETFFSGNKKITDGLASLSLAGLTLPIIFDTDGIVCSEFDGEAVPRIYVVDEAGNLLFELPEADQSQIPYLEQAVSSIVSGSTTLPPDVQTITVSNTGGALGGGTLTPASQDLQVLQPRFSSSPAKVAVSFQSAVMANEGNLPAMKKGELTLLGSSNQVSIPARIWKLHPFTVFTSFSDGSDHMRFGKIWRKVPAPCKAGENPVCPISEVVLMMGGQTQPTFDGKYLITAGEKEILVTPGQSKIFIGANSFELGEPFSVVNGVLYGPAKLLANQLEAKMYRFEETICIVAQSLKASVTGPILTTSSNELMFNNYIKPDGGYPQAPDFLLANYPESTNLSTSLNDILARKETKVLVIDFWATWCPPCKSGMPYMEKMYRDYKDKGLQVYGIIGDSRAVDDDYVASILEDDARIRGGLKKLGLDAITYPMLYENRTGIQTFELYNGRSIPRVVVITKDKKWAFTKVGFWEIGHRNLEYTVRRLLGIEESAKVPSLTIKNTGVGELSGTVTCSIPYIKPVVDGFKTLGQAKIDFKFIENASPKIPERGFITLTTNAGNVTIPIQYNPIPDYITMQYEIDVESFETVVNTKKVNISTPAKVIEGKHYLAIDVVMSMQGGVTKILPDRKRAKSTFENWEIMYISGSQELSIGPLAVKADKPVLIEGGHVFVDLDTLCYILAMDYEFKNEKKTVVLRYEQ